MNKTKLPIRKRLENVPQFSGSVDAAVAEVGATNRLGLGVLAQHAEVRSSVQNLLVLRHSIGFAAGDCQVLPLIQL
ncbi:hypothetical protein AgCh_001451 [Apium graveolens]